MTMENQAIKNCDTDLKDILEEIPDGELANLRDLFKVDWPSHVHIHNFIDNAISWKQDNDKKHFVTVYSIDGNWKDGTFIALIQMFCYDVLFYSFDKSLRRIQKAFKETRILNWGEKQLLFPATRIEFVETIFKVKEEVGHPSNFDVPSNIWWLPKEAALQFEWSIPSDVYVDTLQICHADTMNAVWPHKTPGSEAYIAKLIEVNGGIGLFSKCDKELCAWVLKNYLGGLGILQVDEKHKRKGYGSLVTKIFSKQLAEQGLDSFGCIVLQNTVSQKMFSRLGFTKITAITWIEG